MQAYKYLVKQVIKNGHSVSVWDGEEWQVKRSTNLKDITEAVESVDEAQLRIRDQQGNILGWALVSSYGLADDETIMDYSDNAFMRGIVEDVYEYMSQY